MTADATLWLVANSASGSNDDDALAALVGQLGAAGHAPARVIDCAAEDPPSRVALEQAGVATLVVFTGDGTVSALLPPLEGWSGGVLVLPGGTTNLLAKMLHSPCETGAIIAALAAGRSRVVRHPCVRMSGHVAL
jgi:diacylglycerol kinase family enzyme